MSHFISTRLAAVLSLTFASAPALAGEALLTIQPATVDPGSSASPEQPATAAADRAAIEASPARVEYGAEGSRWWIITAGWGIGINGDGSDEADDFNAAAAYSYFIVKDIEVNAELGAWYHSQGEQDAASINLSVVFRWHFIDRGSWTVFTDAGIGALLATEEVPTGGTNFDFTPRAGLGFTHQLGDSSSRLIVGVRWAHFSNARLTGDDDNPGRDDIMFYGGVILPF